MTARKKPAPQRASAATDPLHELLSKLAELIAERVASRLSLDGRDRKPETAKALPDFLSEADVSRRTGLSRRTLQGWRHRGCGPPKVLAGRRVLYSCADLDSWLKTRTRAAVKQPKETPVSSQ